MLLLLLRGEKTNNTKKTCFFSPTLSTGLPYVFEKDPWHKGAVLGPLTQFSIGQESITSPGLLKRQLALDWTWRERRGKLLGLKAKKRCGGINFDRQMCEKESLQCWNLKKKFEIFLLAGIVTIPSAVFATARTFCRCGGIPVKEAFYYCGNSSSLPAIRARTRCPCQLAIRKLIIAF